MDFKIYHCLLETMNQQYKNALKFHNEIVYWNYIWAKSFLLKKCLKKTFHIWDILSKTLLKGLQEQTNISVIPVFRTSIRVKVNILFDFAFWVLIEVFSSSFLWVLKNTFECHIILQFFKLQLNWNILGLLYSTSHYKFETTEKSHLVSWQQHCWLQGILCLP